MSTQATLSKNTTVIALKGGMFTLTTIQLLEYNLEELSLELDEKIKQAPNFFQHAPIILDLQRLKTQGEMVDLALLIHTLKTKKLIPIGVRGANKLLKDAAIQVVLAIFPEEKVIANKKRIEVEEPKLNEPTNISQAPGRP